MATKSQKALQNVIDQLKYDIILGRLRPYEPLVEDALISRFSAKRHVVRRAIAELVEKGTVIKEPGRSARVRFFSAQEVEHMYDVRTTLHSLAVEIMTLPADPVLVSRLRKYQRDHARAVARRDHRGVYLANENFHDALFAACGNRYLIETIYHYEWLSNPIRSYGIAQKSLMAQSISDHKAMINALAAGDRHALKRLVVNHVKPGKQVYLQSLGLGNRPLESEKVRRKTLT
jgi:DNA-binding GntR family transcriptional regulator